MIRYGIAWRAMPNDLPPWHAVHQQAHRWLAAGCFETVVLIPEQHSPKPPFE
nr:transposase [Acidisoma silvae]